MNVDDLKTAYAWQEALELAKHVMQICEEFSDADTNVLVWHLRASVVDIPAGIATDLQAARPASMEAVVKLVTALQLVNNIYPAIETAEAESRLAKLLERMQSKSFAERQPEPESESPEGDEDDAAADGQANAGPEADDEPVASSSVVMPKVDGVGRQ